MPKFDPIPGQAPPVAQPISQQNTGTPSSPTSGPPPVRVPALSPDKVAEYSGLFEKSGAENGMLNGLVAKQIFERARLPNEVLGRIWGLADTQGRGTLDVTEFVIAMHLLASYKSGAMRGVPNTLPPGLLDAASRRAPARLSSGMPQPARPSSSAGAQPLQQQYSGMQSNIRPQSPIVNRQMAGTPLSAQSTGEPWLISAPDKARFDQVFSTVDTAGQGFISGEQAVQFFGNARLPEDVLAQIWDLADINSDGVLNRDEFAVAMYLIRLQRGSKDGRVPNVLPAGLVPPSMRKQQQPSAPATIPTFDDAPVTKPRSAADDLFGLDVNEQPPQQPSMAPQVPQPTGSTDAGPFASPIAPMPPSSPPPATLFKPFVPSSSFGQGLVPQQTGAPLQQRSKEASLMDDEDEAAPARINNDAAELGNLSNQVGNLSKQMQDVSGQRAQAESELAQTTQQKQAFQQRLTQLRAAYDQEVSQVKSLKDQLATSQAETKRLQQDMAMIEGTHADLRTQHQQLASALAADQQENASLKERIRQMNSETEQLRPQIEKFKSDARQQKGLVAINKKQLATNESECDRIKAEIAAIQQEHEQHRRDTEESARQLEQSQREMEEHQRQLEEHKRQLEQAKAQPLPTPAPRELSPPPQIASPTPSMSSNPFFRQQEGAVFSPPIGSAVASPQPQHEHDRNSAFDAIFGPSFGTAAPAPSTSFGHETPKIQEPETSRDIHSRDFEPPSPAPAAQIDSSALPIRQPIAREDSMTSSVRVAPPASRLSPAHTPRALTPDTSTASPSSQRADDPFTSSAVDEQQESVRQTLPRGDTLQKMETLPGAFPTSRSETPSQSVVNPTALAVGAGAATLATGAGIAAAVEHQQDKKPESETKDNFDDFFGGPSHKKTLSEQHADFDSAFATMNTHQPTAGATTSNQEFPDIQELEDDESSDDESDPRGFDDHFAPSSTAAGKQPEHTPSAALAPPPFTTQTSSSTLPGIESQQSPPDYKEAVPGDNPNHFPMEYKNLLPERDMHDPTSPPPTAGGSTHPGPNPAGEPPSYGPEIGSPSGSRSTSHEEILAPPPTRAAPFDFDSAFANVGEAPVADESDSDYEDVTPPTSGHPQHVGFDPSFDSPAAASTSTRSTTQPTFSAHDAVTSPVMPQTNGTSTFSSSNPTQGGFSDFDEFNANPFPPSRTGTQPSTTSPIQPNDNNAISHDWDELFKPLDNQAQPGTQPPAQVPEADNGAPLTQAISRPQPTEIGAGQTALTMDEEIQDLTPPGSSRAIPTTSITPSSPTTASYAPPKGRPQPGRALSTGTEHDDPILKRLTAMGWSRQESLDALEKFDYNIDKVRNISAFRDKRC